MIRDDDQFRRQITILVLRAVLDEGRGIELRPFAVYIAERLLPVLEREEAAVRGRGDRADGAGEMVQAFIDSGMDQLAARKLIADRTQLKLASVASAHRRFLKTGRQAMLYGRPIVTPRPR